MAGLLLKTNIRLRLSAFPVEVVAYVKANIFSVIGDPLPMIRNTVGTVIDTLIVELGPANWPEALSTLMELVDSQEQFVQEVHTLVYTSSASIDDAIRTRERSVVSINSVKTSPRSSSSCKSTERARSTL